MDTGMKYISIAFLCILLIACKRNTPKHVASAATVDPVQQIVPIDTIAVDSAVDIKEQAAYAAKEEVFIVEAYVDPIEIIPLTPYVDDTPYVERKPKYQTPFKNVFLELTDTTVQNGVYIFYYSPRMDDGSYSYQQHLGGDNNFLGWVSRYGKDVVSIPDTIEPGAQLLFRSIGRQPYSIYVDSLNSGGYTPIQLMPKTYTATVVLKAANGKILADMINEVPIAAAFYGECNPIYFEDGNHADPICAFSCMANCYPYVYYSEMKEALANNQKAAKRLYKALKKGKRCSFMLSSGKKGAIAEIEQHPDNEPNDFLQALRAIKWNIRSSDGIYFQQRLIFTVK